MENNLNQVSESENSSGVSFGIPDCECHHCIDELMDEDTGEIIVTMDTLKVWLAKECPMAKNPNPPPSPGPGTPLRLAA